MSNHIKKSGNTPLKAVSVSRPNVDCCEKTADRCPIWAESVEKDLANARDCLQRTLARLDAFNCRFIGPTVVGNAEERNQPSSHQEQIGELIRDIFYFQERVSTELDRLETIG